MDQLTVGTTTWDIHDGRVGDLSDLDTWMSTNWPTASRIVLWRWRHRGILPMRNYFILNGVDSRDFGVYISGQGTFDAPQKSYTFYNVPGRDGALLSSDNRLENATLTYEAFIYKDFNENVANFRTFLLSLNGYAKLTDSYHPDEFRYAVYTGPFEPKVQSKNDAGSFKITFSCKPQRYLLSGEAEWDVGSRRPRPSPSPRPRSMSPRSAPAWTS